MKPFAQQGLAAIKSGCIIDLNKTLKPKTPFEMSDKLIALAKRIAEQGKSDNLDTLILDPEDFAMIASALLYAGADITLDFEQFADRQRAGGGK